ARNGQGNVLQAVQERQDLCRLLPEWRHRRSPELSLLRRKGRQGGHAGAGFEPLPRGQWRTAVFLCEGRNGGLDRLYGFTLARQANGHDYPDSSKDARALPGITGLYL